MDWVFGRRRDSGSLSTSSSPQQKQQQQQQQQQQQKGPLNSQTNLPKEASQDSNAPALRKLKENNSLIPISAPLNSNSNNHVSALEAEIAILRKEKRQLGKYYLLLL